MGIFMHDNTISPLKIVCSMTFKREREKEFQVTNALNCESYLQCKVVSDIIFHNYLILHRSIPARALQNDIIHEIYPRI